MRFRKQMTPLVTILVLLLALPVWSGTDQEFPQPQEKLHGFTVANLYENGAGQVMGARFISDEYGFIVDLVQVESVPQAFMWVKTPPTSSMGEPHACEHLLLGKGNRGRHVAVLEDMSLANSTAYTAQTRTCYHFNTSAGEDTFYDIFEAKLYALRHPDFTDEEIRREVCHIGVNVDQQDGTLSIDEKGTVYTEMVSGFEKPWYYYGGEMNRLVYGENHPLSYISGGDPDVMREMAPADMQRFHKETHHLSNMGAIVSIPDDVSVEDCLKNMSGILKRCQEKPDSSPTVGISAYHFPPSESAAVGTMKLTSYPSENPADPGYTVFAWPNDLELDAGQLFLLELFLQTFASGETSNLYNLFINSQTRKVDLGGNYVWSGVDSDLGISIYVALMGVDNAHITEPMLDSIRTLIVGEFRKVHDYADGSQDLDEFNQRVRSRVIQNKKQTDKYLNSPPMFGFRSGAGSGWLSLMIDLEREEGFRKSLVLKERYAEIERLLDSDTNFWRNEIDFWKVLTVTPYAVGAAPSPEVLTKATEAKQKRLKGYIEDFKKKYGVDDDQLAIAKYKEEFDANTAILEAEVAKDELPGFIENPPLTLDDQLKYETITLTGGIPMVASTFENMAASRLDLSLRMDVVPESLMVYLPFVPSVLTDIGVTKDGEIVPFDQMREALRREVLGLGAYYDHGLESGRVELVLSGQGNNREELENALGWMEAALYTPYLSVDNLPRMMDVIDQSLISYRNTMKSSEERWVRYPANGYRFQDNPLFMSTYCFLTETHHIQRLKWLLTDPGDQKDQTDLSDFLKAAAGFGRSADREQVTALLSGLENVRSSEAETPPLPEEFSHDLSGLSEGAFEIVIEITKTLKACLNEIPDENLAADFVYLCNEIKADLLTPPEQALAGFNTVLDLIRRTDNARLVMISNSADREATMPLIEEFVGKLGSEKSTRQQYADSKRILERLKSRESGLDHPLYVGLVHEGTRNGVVLFSARHADHYDTSTAAVIDCLTGKLYGGGGGHGIFMKTWAAGLAYSNGYTYSQATGRLSYYAERCPDVAETIRFVVGVLKEAEEDPALLNYAVAQVFGFSRAPSRYEARGVSMATDLIDGFEPEKVAAFRSKVLDIKNNDGLHDKLRLRMRAAYGPVLIGYGPSLAESKDANFFLIGPEPQFTSLEKYIATVEEPQPVYRLYPRDFWLTAEVAL
jgi:Zn-dependent M16 (insulinase) family peptidase